MVNNCNKIKDRIGRLAIGENDVQKNKRSTAVMMVLEGLINLGKKSRTEWE